MKICPQCQTSYTDDSLQFCLQDGTPLVSSAATNNWSESETLVTPRTPDKMRVDVAPPQSATGSSRETIVYEKPKKSNTALIVTLTVLLTLLAVGAGAIGVLYFKRNNKKEVVQDANSKPQVNGSFSNTNQNLNVNSVVNSNANQTPTATPTLKPALSSDEIDEIKSKVKDVVEDWNDALDDRDLDEHLANYANAVDYYKAGSVGIGRIRADKQRAFDSYDDINIKISNIKVTADESGERAIAVFDKEWTFEGENNFSSGKVQQQLNLAKIGGKWRITAEKDLKVYYVNK